NDCCAQGSSSRFRISTRQLIASPRHASGEIANSQMKTFRLHDAIADLIEGFRRWETWSVLAWNDIRQRYRRSTIGPFWLTLSMGITIAGLAYLYAGLFGQALQNYL